MPRDYYEILGVKRDADDAAIKKAYRKLAKKFHPDVNKDAGAQQRFAEVQEAYDVLSDKTKRGNYDQFGHAGVNLGSGAGPGSSGAGPRGQRTTYGGPGGFNVRFDQQGGGVRLDDVFEQLFGGHSRGDSGFGVGGDFHQQRGPTPGKDLETSVTVPFLQAAQGGTVTLKLSGSGGPQSIEMKIPKGVDDGAKLRLRGKGQPSPNGGPAGDLILSVHVTPHPWFKRDGLDLSLDVPVSIDEAVFGATIQVPTLGGKANLKIPPHTSSGAKLRIRGAGIESAKGQKGDFYARIQIKVPDQLDAEATAALEKLRGKLPDARHDLGW